MLSGSKLDHSPAHRSPLTPALAVGVVGLLLLAALPSAAAQTSSLPPLGMSVADIGPLSKAGAPPLYASYWVGEWMARSGWDGFDNAMRSAKAAGVTPVVYWYYWGDTISPYCVDNGCNSRDRAEWTQLTNELATHLRTTLQGAPVLIVLENEFNKAGITGDYAPTFDAHLEKVARTLKSVPGTKIVLGFGAWGENNWDKFPRSAAQSDYIGFQMMRASTKDTETSYRDAATRTAYLTRHIAEKFDKPSFLYDLALSSYPDAKWERLQAETLDSIFQTIVSTGHTGLQGVVYRGLNDIYMDPSNYYGYAESHWGLKKMDGTTKPAFDIWIKHAKGAAPAPAPAPAPTKNVPGVFEAESMSATKGGRASDSSASGGAIWNLWSNGELRTTLVADAPLDARISVTARGQLAAGVGPRMELRVGSMMWAYDVPATTTTYRVDAPIPQGSTDLRIVFTNDVVLNGEDRNLLVDVVRVEPRPVNQPPTAAFSADVNGLAVKFDGSASSDPEKTALTHAWDLGDGRSSSGAIVAHEYAASGNYTVTLRVSDGELVGTASQVVRVVKPNAAPTASIVVTGANDTYTFDASNSRDPDGDALSHSWSLSDGATVSGVKFTRTFPAGTHRVTLTLTDARGATAEASAEVVSSTPPKSPDTDPIRDPAPAPAPAPVSAKFTPHDGNEWWVQARVDADQPLASVCASIDGAACRPLEKKSWGSYAASFYAPAGSRVVFHATSTSGASVDSIAYEWPSMRPVSAAAQPAPFAPEFQPYGGNDWWVQTRIEARTAIEAVCASVNRGPCEPLALREWGAWAASLYAPKGAKVVFTATAVDGQQANSVSYNWPMK